MIFTHRPRPILAPLLLPFAITTAVCLLLAPWAWVLP